MVGSVGPRRVAAGARRDRLGALALAVAEEAEGIHCEGLALALVPQIGADLREVGLEPRGRKRRAKFASVVLVSVEARDETLPPTMIRRLVVCASLLAACRPAARPSPVADAACGAAGEPSPWCNGPFPGPDPAVSPLARLALIDALAAACPPATADDPTPGLSRGARALMLHGRGHMRMQAPIGLEITALERLLAATPESSAEHVLIVDRLAEDYFALERSSYEACREARVLEVATRSALSVEETRVRLVIEGIRGGRERAERQCAELARVHPEHVIHAPCAG